MSKLSYQDRLQQLQSDKDLQEQQYQVEQTSLQLQSDISATKQSVAASKKIAEDTKSGFPFNAKAIIDAQNNLAAAEAGLKALTALQAELFPAK